MSHTLHGILDPTGAGPAQVQAPPVADRARRPPSLAGLRVGLLDNTKHNALLFLRAVGDLLTTEHGAREVSIVETKQNFSVPVDRSIVDRYREHCDVVITGVGDCGSCSAAAVADGIAFERAGLPAAVVLTDAFDITGRAMAQVQGDADYEWVETEHPMAVLTEDEVRARARTLVSEIVGRLTMAEAA
ncbi:MULTISPECIES: UGSC family (seleno)protein [Micrococcaceae]|uniref:UGSC family (seleno)protein n=1 Tax=Micrococcaceae TaxID=1268 RepID=UPI0016188B80|nr:MULTISPECIES: UGSC family (seleno)protein [Micrococcaceae]MBB5750816.1 hypothetical protein [Micrococcus sp. TA1]MBB5750954.1 hypothetical protein [Micrococcus sp. TA1]HRO30323.1 UGSC family (seleno)protein [Citricoccus sp.]HRO93330.1 UGSC family (seleno)protein [Citricoccus sp.]